MTEDDQVSGSIVKVRLSPDSDLFYTRLLHRETPAILSDMQILRMGLEKLLGREVSRIQFESSPEEQLRSQRLLMADLEKRLTEKSSSLEELTQMLREYQRDRTSVESVLPVLERQTLDLKRALGMKVKTPPRFIKEENL
jgi:hypothetical protein